MQMLRAKPCILMHQVVRRQLREVYSSCPLSFASDSVALLPLLETVSDGRGLRRLHVSLIVSDIVDDPISASQHVSSAAVSGFTSELSIFSTSPSPNLFTWNTMMKRLTDGDRNSLCRGPILLYKEMLEVGTRPNGHTFVYLLKGLATRIEFREGEEVHSCILKSGFGCSQFVSSALVVLYVVCGSVDSARKVFDEVPQQGLVLWTAIMRGYACSNSAKEAIVLFMEMRARSVTPDSVALAICISACGQMRDLVAARSLHGFVIKSGIRVDAYVSSELLTVYGDCGSLDLALSALNETDLQRNIVVWNAMIHQSAKHNDLGLAVHLFNQMPEKDVVTWNTLMGGLSRAGRCKEALALFHRMESSGLRPNASTLTCALSACAHLGALDTAVWIHAYAEKNQMNLDGSLDPALIDMYAKCGNVERALQVFERVPREDLFSWTTIICALAMHGDATQALDLFSRMKNAGIRPDGVTIVGVLNACSHAGLKDKGYVYFQEMEGVYNIKPKIEHYGCMVDLLGRMGHLREAHDLIKQMPMKPNAIIWGSLLSSCRVHNNVLLARIAAERMLELDPEDMWPQVMLSNIHAQTGQWNQVMRLRKELKEKQMKKMPGCSMIEVNGEVHEFLVADHSHLQDTEIRSMLQTIELQSSQVK